MSALMQESRHESCKEAQGFYTLACTSMKQFLANPEGKCRLISIWKPYCCVIFDYVHICELFDFFHASSL